MPFNKIVIEISISVLPVPEQIISGSRPRRDARVGFRHHLNSEGTLIGCADTISSEAPQMRQCKLSQTAFACSQETRLHDATPALQNPRQSPGTG